MARIGAACLLLPGALLIAQGSVSPTSLNWVSVPVGGKGGQKVVTLTNSGATAITISSIGFAGTNPGDFEIFSKTCGTSLAAASSCTANIIFAPTTTGNRSATLKFTDSASNSPQSMSLTGYGAPVSGTVSVSPTSHSFGNINVGSSSATVAMTLSNGTASSITISSIAITGTNAGDFSISSKSCGSSLAAAGNCSASVVFKPSAAGTRSATLSFADSATGSPQTVALSGTGTSTTGGSASVSPTNLNWVSVSVGGIGGQKVATLTNSGTATLTVSSVTLGGTNPGDFKIYSKTCGSSLGAGASCTANVVFAPTESGNLSATLDFNDSATNTPQAVTLTGYAPGGGVSASPAALTFASTSVGSTSSALAATLKNGTSSSITISSVAITGTNAGDFSISGKSCSTSLAASGTCSASVTFKPSAAGTRSATLSFTDSGTGSPQTVALTGTGASSTGGNASVSPANLNWVSVSVGGIGGQKVATLTNSGTTTLTISSVALGGTNPGDFKIYSKTCGTSLAASASCTANVVFAPTQSGNLSATLNFNDSATNTPQAVTLTGYAPGGTLTISPVNPSVTVSGTLHFTASAPSSWTTSCGTIGSSTGLYTAPATTGSCTVKASATSGGQTASTTVTVTAASGHLAVTPTSVSLHAIGTAQFTANQSVTWSASCGSISSSGLFTAPVANETCTVKATSTTNSSSTASATAQVSVVDYTVRKNGTDGTGVQSKEFSLTPTTVSSGKFSQLWSVGLDGPIWGQPLYMNGISVGGKVRNVVYVTTSNDSVYALDADTGSVLWKKSFLSTGVTAVAGASLKISNQIGILSTPVIDPVKQALFVVAETSENNATYFPHRLHALSLTTGQELTADPEVITDPDLQPIMKFQRPALLLANGMVYVALGSIEDRAPYHGLLFAFDENTLEQKALWNVTPTGSEGGLWMSGSAPMADSEGNIYISTGNGSAGSNNFGESIVKLSPSLQELDYFTPYNYSTFNSADLDVGSGSLILVPDQNGPYPHEIIACGKPKPIYVIDRDAFGGRGTTSDNVIQEVANQIGGTGSVRDSGQPCYNSPGMWQQNLYVAANYDVLKMFVLNPATGLLSTTPTSKGTFVYNWPGADPVISANGSTSGIVWTIDVATGTLRANDATNVSKTLYTSPNLGSPTRWVPPTVANGHVYVTASGKIIAFGLTQ